MLACWNDEILTQLITVQVHNKLFTYKNVQTATVMKRRKKKKPLKTQHFTIRNVYYYLGFEQTNDQTGFSNIVTLVGSDRLTQVWP